MNHDLLHNALIYLAAAIVLVPLTHRLGLGSVLGYILGGVIIGPFALGWIDSSTDVLHFSEFGVVMLLFLVGLELNPRRLWALRRLIFGLGAAQVLGTAALLSGGALLLGVDFNVAVVAGLGLAMSSTALVIQLMNERGLMKTSPGEATFSILLFQDLAVIPMMALLPLLDGNQVDSAEVSDWMLALKGFGAIAFVILMGRFLIRPAFRWAAAKGWGAYFTLMEWV
jgi:glutathione-regulated potassium-efflux system ancillary protein KefC